MQKKWRRTDENKSVSSSNFSPFGGLRRLQRILPYGYQVLHTHTRREEAYETALQRSADNTRGPASSGWDREQVQRRRELTQDTSVSTSLGVSAPLLNNYSASATAPQLPR